MTSHFKRDSDFSILDEIRNGQKEIIKDQQQILQNQAIFKVTLAANAEKIKEHETIFYGANRTNGIIHTIVTLSEDQDALFKELKRDRKLTWQRIGGMLGVIGIFLTIIKFML